MASIERTAYPRFNSVMSDRKLPAWYEVTLEERGFIKAMAKGEIFTPDAHRHA